MASVRILFITSAYPSNSEDPRGFFIHQLARALTRRGASVTVLAPGSPTAPTRDTLDGVIVRRATYWIPRWQSLATGFGGIVPNLQRRPWRALQIPTLVAALTRDAVELADEADVIHAHWMYPAGVAGAFAARRRGLPLVVTSHGSDLALARRLAPLRWLSRWVCGCAAACVAVSHGQAAGLREIRVATKRLLVVPLGVDYASGAARGTIVKRDEYLKFKSHEGLRIVFVGRLVPSKSVETLLEAHQLLEGRGLSVATAIIGSGPGEQRLRKLTRQNRSANVVFVGAVSPDSVASWLAAADVLVLPSLTEGRGIVILEAMAQAVPVVASDIPGPRELVRHGETGFLFPAGDAKALADRLEVLQRDEALRGQLSRRARGFIEEEGLTADESARRHLALYEELRALPARPAATSKP